MNNEMIKNLEQSLEICYRKAADFLSDYEPAQLAEVSSMTQLAVLLVQLQQAFLEIKKITDQQMAEGSRPAPEDFFARRQ